MSDKVKGILIKVGIGLIIVVIIIIVLKFAFKKDGEDQGFKSEKVQNDAIKYQESKGVKRTMSESALRSMADSWYLAMKGMGTNEDTIEKDLRKMGSIVDLLYVVKYFGVRDDMTLAEWVEDEGLQDDLNEILEQRGIHSFKF